MGTFQVTYDDFTGGHYMGNKVTNQPSNTWFGENALLNSQGELIPSGAVKIATIAAPTLPSGFDGWVYKETNGFFRDGPDLYLLQTWVTFDTNLNFARRLQYTKALDTRDGSPTTTTYTSSTYWCLGQATALYSGGNIEIYFVDYTTDNVCKINTSGTITVVSTALSGTDIRNVEVYKSRMVAWGDAANGSTLYYSDATMTTWATTDYYEFPGNIWSVFARANDLVVITDNGVYSVTGVLGESVNIQLIMPMQDESILMLQAKGTGRSAIFIDRSSVYEMLGGTVYEIGKFSQSDVNKTLTPVYDEQANTIFGSDFNIEAKGNVCIFLDSGVMYVRRQDASFVRMKIDQTIENSVPAVAGPIRASDNYGNCFSTGNDFLDLPAGLFYGSTNVYMFAHDQDLPTNVVNNATLPGSTAKVDLAEYWHTKPMSVKEVIIEVVYDTDQTLRLAGDASVSSQIIPVGVVDMTVNQTSALTSSTQTYTTALSSITSDDSRVIHRYRIDNAPKGYGFVPRITWNSCRIRRVVCICED